MKNTVLLSLLLLILNTNLFSEELLTIKSPDGNIVMVIEQSDASLTYKVTKDEVEIVKPSTLGLKLTTAVTLGSSAELKNVNEGVHDGEIETKLGERAYQIDIYNYARLEFMQSETQFYIDVRVYNEGFAIRYEVNNLTSVGMSSDMTTFDLSNNNMTYYSETGTESGYTKRLPGVTFTSYTPLFGCGDNISININEANNKGIASKMSLSVKSGIVSVVQSINAKLGGFVTPWRYVVFGDTPLEMLEGKYIMYSLNDKEEGGFDWIEPGKVFRSLEQGTTSFHTDSVKLAIDFAHGLNFKYVLLDAGWYGQGYSYEHMSTSNPNTVISTLDIENVVDYAAEKDMGIITYVNKAAWYNYDAELFLDLYKQWGIRGLKMGFMDGLTQSGLNNIYRYIEYANEREMIVNIHDNMRPTGVERSLPNLLTTEGIRGNENVNTTSHTMMLPFTRLMSGAADYTFCFTGYPKPASDSKLSKMPATKGHQMGLSVLLFSPLQHVLWYGKYWWYSSKPEELDFFAELPTVWDETYNLEGEPGEYMAVARKSGEKWFLGVATNETSRNVVLEMPFVEPSKQYKIRAFEDDGNGGVLSTIYENVDLRSGISIDMLSNGGYAAIIEESTSVTELNDVEMSVKVLNGLECITIMGNGLIVAELYSLSGSLVAVQQSNEDGTLCRMNKSGITGGVYILVVKSQGEKHSKRVLIK